MKRFAVNGLRGIESLVEYADSLGARPARNKDTPMTPDALFSAFSLSSKEAKAIMPTPEEIHAMSGTLHTDAPPLSELAVGILRSLTANECAELFAKLEQALVNVKPEDRVPLQQLAPMGRDRCIRAAELAVKVLDPDFRVRVADEAVTRYLHDCFDGIVPTETEQKIEMERARKIIGLFLQAEREEL